MTREEITAFVHDMVADQLGVSKDQVRDDTNIYDHLGADSLDAIEIVLGMEDEFEIFISDADVEGLSTVLDIINYAEKRLATGS